MNKSLLFGIFLILQYAAIGCGDDHDDGHDHGHDHDHSSHDNLDPTGEACFHMAGGPATEITAGGTESEAADTQSSDWEHKRVDVTLNDDGAGGFNGYLTYEAGEDAEFIFFTSGEFTIQIDGVDAESTAAVTECSEVVNALVFDLTVGEHLVFIAATTGTVSLVAEEAGDHSGG